MIQSIPLSRPFSLSGIICFMLVLLSLLGCRESFASFSAAVQFEQRLLSELDVEWYCGGNKAGRTDVPVTRPGIVRLQEGDFESASIDCRAKAILPAGYSVSYAVSGDSPALVDRNGCLFAQIKHGQSNVCQITVTQNPVRLTVYKKWIGAASGEDDVRISLECESGDYSGYRHVNEGSPDGWEIRNIAPEGILCNISETVRDNFNPDIIDCQGLYILPGKGEACTLINTKIIKRIEMLNRYGKLIMVVLVLAVGLIALKRFN
jgi:hypothetical protein